MTPTKLLIGQALIALAVMALGFWAATQWTAAMLGSILAAPPFHRAAYRQGEPVTELVPASLASALEAIVPLRGNDADVAL